MIILMAGLPGTGKSAVARELSARLNGTTLCKDTLRHTLFEQRDVEYSRKQDDFCMDVMLETAGYILGKHADRTVILDGRTFSKRYQVERVIRFAERLQQPWRIFECVCSDETARQRLDAHQDHPAGNRNYDLYLRVRGEFEEIRFSKTLLDTDQALQQCVEQALDALI
jgi:predicted kinase